MSAQMVAGDVYSRRGERHAMNISVITPCHNCGPWGAQALRSVVVPKPPATLGE